MREMRRRFAIGLAAGIFLAAGAELLFAQKHARRTVQQQPDHAPVIGTGTDAARLESKAARAAMLLQNEKEFREGVEQLYSLVNELKQEVEKTPTPDVLSVRMYKKAREIEKLAKQIKNKGKG